MSSISVLPIEQLHRRADARPLNDDALAALCDSIEQIGLVNPIRVRRNGEGYEVIAGAHRFAACDLLGRRQIECIIVDDDDLRAELAMIDENLMRAELSASERATSTARRKALYLKIHPETAVGENQHTRVRQVGEGSEPADRFTAETASATGRSERAVQRDAERGERVIPEVMEMIRGTKLDTGTYLDKIKRLPPNEQVPAAKRDLAEPRPPAQPRGGVAARYEAAATNSAPASPDVFKRFVSLADELVSMPVSGLVADSGRQRAVLGQRASGLIDHLSEILEALE